MTTQAKRTPGPEYVRAKIENIVGTAIDAALSDCDPRPISAGQYSGCIQSVTDALLSAFPAAFNAEAKVREALERERPSSEMGEWLNLGPQPGCTPSLIPIATAHRIWRAYEFKRAALALLDGEGNGNHD